MSETLTREMALSLCSRILGVSMAVQAFELLRLFHDYFCEDGIWRWSIIRREFVGWPKSVRSALDMTLGGQGFSVILLLQLSAAVMTVWSPSALSLGGLAACALAGFIRLAGFFNGGSDSMTWVVLPALLVAQWMGPTSVPGGFALAWICAQGVLSYFVAGWVKLRETRWRSGRALQDYLLSSHYIVPTRLRRWVSFQPVAFLLAWAVMTFELSSPFALTGSQPALVFVLLAAGFHLGNFWAFGLNRFFFAWAATWPAIFYFASMRNPGGF